MGSISAGNDLIALRDGLIGPVAESDRRYRDQDYLGTGGAPGTSREEQQGGGGADPGGGGAGGASG